MRFEVRSGLWAVVSAGLLALATSACGDDHGHDHEQELITTLVATLTSTSASSVTARFSDPDGPGGADPVLSQPAPLSAGARYQLTLQFLDESVDPAVDRTDEIKAEAEEHQVFFDGPALSELVSISYADKESDYTTNAVGDDLPVGVAAELRALRSGTGAVTITLKHLPAVDGSPTKTASSRPEDGETDVSVEFQLRVE